VIVEAIYSIRNHRRGHDQKDVTKVIPILAAAFVLAAAQVAFAAGKPRVGVEAASPLTVVGAGFPAREAVVVTVRATGLTLRKTVRSTASGTFSARWSRTVTTGGCKSPFLVVSARAADGTLAVWKPAMAGVCRQPKDP
jgi:hypothetical protein